MTDEMKTPEKLVNLGVNQFDQLQQISGMLSNILDVMLAIQWILYGILFVELVRLIWG